MRWMQVWHLMMGAHSMGAYSDSWRRHLIMCAYKDACIETPRDACVQHGLAKLMRSNVGDTDATHESAFDEPGSTFFFHIRTRKRTWQWNMWEHPWHTKAVLRMLEDTIQVVWTWMDDG